MARPKKYNWELIKKSYEDGFDIDKLCDLYKIEKKTLQNKVSKFRWQVTGSINNDFIEFKESLGKISGYISQNDDIKNNHIINRVDTILEDNELTMNNRKILKAFQGKIIAGLKNGAYDKATDIKAGTGAIKDIESVVNPTNSKIEVNNSNNQQNKTTENNVIEVIFK